MWRGREGEATAREGGICGKSQGALFSKSRTQKAPLFPTTWAHQARYVRRRELTRQPGPRRAREGSSYVAVPGARGWGGGELCEATGNFPGTQYAPWCHSQKQCPRGWGARWALFSAKAGKGRQRRCLLSSSAFLLALCLPALDLPFPGPHREGTAQLGPLEATNLLICTLPVHICMWAGETDGSIQVAENPAGYGCTRMT